MNVAELRSRLSQAGQAHVLQFWPELQEAQQAELYAELEAMDFEELHAFFQKATAESGRAQRAGVDARMEPVPRDVLGSATRDQDQLQAWESEGTEPANVCPQVCEDTLSVSHSSGTSPMLPSTRGPIRK